MTLSNWSQRPSPDESASDEDDSFLPDDDEEGLDDSVGHEPWYGISNLVFRTVRNNILQEKKNWLCRFG